MMMTTGRRFLLAMCFSPLGWVSAVQGQETGLSEDVAPVPEIVNIPPAPPHLDQDCTISILNRTACVRPDGSWVLTNVPSNFGPVRARATCIYQGTTLTGQSEPFTVPANGVIRAGDIRFDIFAPIPSFLDVSVPDPLTEAGATAPLDVVAVFSDGAIREVPDDPSTSYRSSNPAVATVDGSGRVTAVASGATLITVLHEAVSTFVRVVVLLGGDADGDGIPDDLEVSNGLDPGVPADALEDVDRDGLTAKEELIDFGTDILNPDTDADAIADGEETIEGADGFVTNPALADTDGDGFDDGAEVSAGSDPTDPNSVPAAGPSSGLEVTPSPAVIVVNTIMGLASKQLTVTSQLEAGGTFDVTADPATRYSSSDRAVCNFGERPGEIFAGGNGNCTITVTNGGFSAEVLITVVTFAPRAIALAHGSSTSVDVSGDFAFATEPGPGGNLAAVDVSDPRIPIARLSDRLSITGGFVEDVKVTGDIAFLVGGAGLIVVDVADPRSMFMVSSLATPGDAQDLVIRGDLAFVADGAGGLRIIDVSDTSAPTDVGDVDTGDPALGVDVNTEAGIAAVATGTAGVKVVSIRDLASPAVVGSVPTEDARDLVIDGAFAYVADFRGSLTIVDLSDPAQPFVVASTAPELGGILVDVVLADGFALGADVFYVNAVPIVDVTDPGTPLPRAVLDFSVIESGAGSGIAVDRGYVYLATETGIYIGQYRIPEDPGGNPPTVSVNSFAPRGRLVEGEAARVVVEAEDDYAVVAVHLTLDGEVVDTDTDPPFELQVTVPAGVRSIDVGAMAIDSGDNVGVAEVLTVPVIPDPLTTVNGQVVDLDGNPVDGATVTAGGVEGATGVDGFFSLGGVPTSRGEVRCVARALAGNGALLRGVSISRPPIPANVTNVGIFEIGFLEFETPRTFEPPGRPRSLTVTDLDLDGAPDLVVGHDQFSSVSIYRGRGDGRFEPARRQFAFFAPVSVAAADFDGDALPDLVTGNGRRPALTTLLGNGDLTFRIVPQGHLGHPSLALPIAAGDLDADGLPDIVAPIASGAQIFFNDGAGLFRFAGNVVPLFRFAAHVVLDDYNGDGRLDVAGTGGQRVEVAFGNGDGTIGEVQVFASGGRVVPRIASADFNGDGRADLVAGNADRNDMSVFLAQDGDTFGPPESFVTGDRPTFVTARDLNGDGNQDIVTPISLVLGRENIGGIVALIGNGDGTFQPAQTIASGLIVLWLEAADLNGDGAVDLVATAVVPPQQQLVVVLLQVVP